MKQIFTPLSIFLIGIGTSVFGQTAILNDFETGAPTNVSRYGLTSNITIVPNPFPDGSNSTDNCAQVSRTTSNWYELFAFPVNFSVPANTKQYVHMLVNYYAQPDISIRIDAPDVNSDGVNPFRSLNKYTDLGKWQDLVFEIDGASGGLTVSAIIVHPDAGFENTPVQQVLNNTDKFGYIDEILVNDSPTALGVNDFNSKNLVAVYPNPTSDVLNVTNLLPNSLVSINSIDGKNVYNSKSLNNNLSLSTKGWSKGVYVVTIKNGSQRSAIKKFIVQ
jgi:hypothetical protein